MSRRGYALVVLLLVLATGASACTSDSEEGASGPMVIDAPWVGVASAGQNSAAYMGITNESESEDKLVSVAADVASTVEIHETVTEGDETTMQELSDGLLLPVDETVLLEPQGLHIMLVELEEDLVEGDTVELTLKFENAGDIVVEAPVRQVEEAETE